MSIYVRRLLTISKLPFGVCRRNSTKTDPLTKELLSIVNNQETRISFRKTLHKLEAFDPGWSQNLKEHKTVSSIANSLVQESRYEELDLLVEKMNIDNCSVGMQTTIVKSYIDRQLWSLAIPLFDELESKMKHIRPYHALIQGLCKHGQVTLAHQYLEKLLQKEYSIKFKRNTTTSQKTLQAILMAISQDNEEIKDWRNIKTALDYMQQGDYGANEDIMNSLSCVFKSHNYFTCLTSIKDNYFCQTCHKDLKIDNNHNEVLKQVCEKIEKQVIEKGSHSFLQSINESFNNNTFYNYVVDVANVLRRPKLHQNFQALKTVIDNIVQKSENHARIVLVLPRGGRNKSLDLTQYLKQLSQKYVMKCHIEIVATNKLNDDLLVLYVGAKSAGIAGSKQNINIISNDVFSEYIDLVSKEQQFQMLHWLRSSVKGVDERGNICFTPYLPRVVLDEEENIHVRGENDQILCVQKNI